MSDQEETLGIRGLLARVNLKDFGDMVRDEFVLVGTSVRLAVKSRPWVMPFALAAALLRFVLLLLVIVGFGSAILVISLVRGLFRAFARPHPHAV